MSEENEDDAEETDEDDAEGLGSDGTFGDLDGDGDLDVLAAAAWDDTLAWFENDGSGVFTENVITATALDAWQVTAADVDSDATPKLRHCFRFLPILGRWPKSARRRFTRIANRATRRRP